MQVEVPTVKSLSFEYETDITNWK